MGAGVTATGTGAEKTITISAAPSTFNAPAITSFGIQGQATSVQPDTTITGAQVFEYSVTNAANVQGTLTLSQAGTALATNVDPAGTTVGLSVTEVTLSAGESVSWTLSGTDTMSNTIPVATFTVRAVQDHEQAYYGVRPTDDFATVDLTSLTPVDVQPPAVQYTISGTWPASNVLGILEPTDRAISSIIETAFNQETFPTLWTRTAGARTIGGQTYDLLTQTNNGPSGNYEYRVTHA